MAATETHERLFWLERACITAEEGIESGGWDRAEVSIRSACCSTRHVAGLSSDEIEDASFC